MTNITTGILIANTSSHAFDILTSSLRAKAHLIAHPMLLPALIASLVSKSSYARFEAATRHLNELEELLGQHSYGDQPMGNPLEIDFPATTRRLSAVSRVIHSEKMRVNATRLSLEMMDKEIASLILPQDCGVDTNAVRVNLDGTVQAHINFCQNLSIRVESEEKKAQGQVAVVSVSQFVPYGPAH